MQMILIAAHITGPSNSDASAGYERPRYWQSSYTDH